MISDFAPAALATFFRDEIPVTLGMGGQPQALDWKEVSPNQFQSRVSDVLVTATYRYDERYKALKWDTTIRNQGEAPIDSVRIVPLSIHLRIDPEVAFPRVRHITGSFHYDGMYPPRAFRVLEERIMTHDHCKPIYIHSSRHIPTGQYMLNIVGSASEHVPILQFATGPYGKMAAFYVGFEWSSAWHMVARWERNSFSGETVPDYLIEGNVGLTELRLEPGEELRLPTVHLIFAEGADWDALDNSLRRYVREGLSARLPAHVSKPPVSYDHWFGIHKDFDVDDLKRQADRAAELGCEYFCLDAAWYRTTKTWADGIGNWHTPDPMKFPRGVEELSDHVRSLGMGFGLWHQLEYAQPDTDMVKRYPALYDQGHLRLQLPEARELALEVMRTWISAWKIDWFRWEFAAIDNWAYEVDPSGKLALAYTYGLYEIIDRLRAEFPNIYVEGCQGGATKLDFGMVVRTHGTWLCDHTANPDVCRFMQMGALRFWSPHLLNSAVRAHRGSGDRNATAYELLSRMVGTFSLNGDIAQWSPQATALAKIYVTAYKSFRHLLHQPVHFPLPQPRSDRDWDVVMFGNADRDTQLLFAFNVAGSDSISIDLPERAWSRLLGSDKARIETQGGKATLHLEPNSSALWTSAPA